MPPRRGYPTDPDYDADITRQALANARRGWTVMKTAKVLDVPYMRIYRALHRQGRFQEYFRLIHQPKCATACRVP